MTWEEQVDEVWHCKTVYMCHTTKNVYQYFLWLFCFCLVSGPSRKHQKTPNMGILIYTHVQELEVTDMPQSYIQFP